MAVGCDDVTSTPTPQRRRATESKDQMMRLYLFPPSSRALGVVALKTTSRSIANSCRSISAAATNAHPRTSRSESKDADARG